jgi:hypothetical protein
LETHAQANWSLDYVPGMWRTARSVCLLLGASAALSLCLAGCGGSDAVVHVQGAPEGSITRAELSHWMQALTGSDFREAAGVQGPSGLVSDPPDYPRCVAAAKLVSARSFFNQLRPSRPKLTKECRELHEAVKTQALEFLISARWTIAEGARRGAVVNDAEVARTFAATRAQSYPTEERLRRYLAERQWSLSDLLYRLKLRTLAGRLNPRAVPALVGDPGAEAILNEHAAHRRRLASITHCQPGYVVPGCSEYRERRSAAASPVALLKKLAWKRP